MGVAHLLLLLLSTLPHVLATVLSKLGLGEASPVGEIVYFGGRDRRGGIASLISKHEGLGPEYLLLLCPRSMLESLP